MAFDTPTPFATLQQLILMRENNSRPYNSGRHHLQSVTYLLNGPLCQSVIPTMPKRALTFHHEGGEIVLQTSLDLVLINLALKNCEFQHILVSISVA